MGVDKDETLDMSISSLAEGEKTAEESEKQEMYRMWNSMSAIDSSRPDDFLPSQSKFSSQSRSRHSGNSLKATRLQLRPDAWLSGGGGKERRSWKPKQVVLDTPIAEDALESNQKNSEFHPTSVHSLPMLGGNIETMEENSSRASFDADAKMVEDKPSRTIPLLISPTEERTSSQNKNGKMDVSGHSVISEDSISRISDVREMWNSMSSLDKNNIERNDASLGSLHSPKVSRAGKWTRKTIASSSPQKEAYVSPSQTVHRKSLPILSPTVDLPSSKYPNSTSEVPETSPNLPQVVPRDDGDMEASMGSLY